MTLQEIIDWYETSPKLPKSIKIDKCTTINNVDNFIQLSIYTLKANPKNILFLPYFERLLKIYLHIKNN